MTASGSAPVAPAVSHRNAVLLVDDQATGRGVIAQIAAGVDEDALVVAFEQPMEALEWAANHVADLVLVDYGMPEIDGIEFVKRMRAISGYCRVPIVMVTIHESLEVRYAALDAGVTDFLTKPLDPRECRARWRNLLGLRRQLFALEGRRQFLEALVSDTHRVEYEHAKESLLRLAKAGEYRDEDARGHVVRTARYSRLVAQAVGVNADDVDVIELAALLHDFGKVGLPDRVLRNVGELTSEDRLVMRHHPTIGHELLKDSVSKYVRMGATIALGHHERFDGSGYPNGLWGDRIPLEARIVAVADVFDALTTVRQYKQAWDAQQAFDYLLANRHSHFDAALVDAFCSRRDEVASIHAGNQRTNSQSMSLHPWPITPTYRGQPPPGG